MQQTINLFTKLDRPQKEWLRLELLLWANGGVLALFLFVTLVVYLLGIVDTKRLDTLRIDVQNLEQELEEKRIARDKHLDPGNINEQIAELESQVRLNRQILNILRSKTSIERDPLSSYMQGLANQHLRGLWFTGFSVSAAGDVLSLRGQTTNPEFVPRYLTMLKAEPVFAGKSFNIFQLSQDKEKHRLLNFEIHSADERDAAVAEVITAPASQVEQMP